ncbi:phosphoribosylanthranilate isomerase [Pseudonocardia sediminis]|uniref:N-(5'-phosphoribosyl)anthranilate isomerase n=1 Tax=Pseudonocardia sediminis TaxID=1397368 RepID=A0A4Q7UZ56_PSEST|nr:phosphoribosylanthranilate isomerase [Pseudonocardia sediminis]
MVKVCGLSSFDDIEVAADAGVDAIGLVVSPSSSRHLDPARARSLAAHVPDSMTSVLVTRDYSAAEATALAREVGTDVLQLHEGTERPDFAAVVASGVRLWRATSLAFEPDLRIGAFGEEVLLLDSPLAGSGETWDLGSLPPEQRPSGPWLLAGGLDPDNVAASIRAVRPWGVDVSSGVESSPGVKDHREIIRFVAAARGATE